MIPLYEILNKITGKHIAYCDLAAAKKMMQNEVFNGRCHVRKAEDDGANKDQEPEVEIPEF
jgi:hypothetical protein